MRRLLLTGTLALLALLPVTSAAASTHFMVPLTGPGGSGTASIVLNPGHEQVCYSIDVTLSTPGDVPQEPKPGLGSAHIHLVATGGIAVDLETQFTETAPGTFSASGCASADRELILDILQNPENYYVNVHTVDFPGGAVTGTLTG